MPSQRSRLIDIGQIVHVSSSRTYPGVDQIFNVSAISLFFLRIRKAVLLLKD